LRKFERVLGEHQIPVSGVNCPGNYSSNSFTCMSSQPNRNHRIHILSSSVLLRRFAPRPRIGSAGRSAYVVMVSRTNLTRATASTTLSSSCSVVIPMRPCVHGSPAFMTLLPIRRETSGGCHHGLPHQSNECHGELCVLILLDGVIPMRPCVHGS
jgi:hypothetical protein